MSSGKIILGIDPGTTIMGFGLIVVQNNKMKLIQFHELQLKKYENHYLKLDQIFKRTIDTKYIGVFNNNFRYLDSCCFFLGKNK